MESISKKLKAVIFDMDGTIIDTEHIWNGVVVSLLKEKGIVNFSKEDTVLLDSLSGSNLSFASHAVKNHFGLTETPEEIAHYKLDLANREFEKKVKFIEGFEAFHKLLRDHSIPSGIATNAHPKNLDVLVQSMEFEKFFGKHIYCIAHVNYKAKPDPALFLHTAAQLGVAPEDCIVFEDSLYGFLAAKAAGMRCIAIKNALNGELIKHATESINNYHEAVEMLKKIV